MVNTKKYANRVSGFCSIGEFFIINRFFFFVYMLVNRMKEHKKNIIIYIPGSVSNELPECTQDLMLDFTVNFYQQFKPIGKGKK